MSKFILSFSSALMLTLTLLVPVAHADFTVFAISPDIWQQGVVGEAFSLQLHAGGGTEPYTWSVTSGTLPDGVNLDASTGLISGEPTTAGSDPVTVQTQDANGAVATKDYALVVYPSVGGLSYSRTPSGQVVSNPITIHLKGVFGADLCDSASTAYQLSVGTYPHSAVIKYQSMAQGTVMDQDFTATLPLDTYSGVYLLCFGGSSGQREMALESSLQTVNNQPPVLIPIGNQIINEGQTLRFTISATDPDGDTLTYSALNLPPGATFDPNTQTFTWTPSYGQAGNYTDVEFTVTDNGTPMMLADELISVTVGHVNRPPVFAPVGPQQASTTVPTSFTVSATDPDNNAVTLSANNVPSGSTFDQNTGMFVWTPTYNQAGVYTVTFTATDNGTPEVASSTLGVVISVSASSPTTITKNLITDVIAANYPTNQLNSYLANLRKVVIFIDNGQIQAAINQLNAFVQKVNQNYTQGLLTQVAHDYLVGEAQSILNALE